MDAASVTRLRVCGKLFALGRGSEENSGKG